MCGVTMHKEHDLIQLVLYEDRYLTIRLVMVEKLSTQTASNNISSKHQVRVNNCTGDSRLELLHSRSVTVVNDISRVVDRIASDGRL